MALRRFRTRRRPRRRQTTLIMTAKLGDIDPLAWLADVLARIADLPQSRLYEFLPWEWKRTRQQAAA